MSAAVPDAPPARRAPAPWRRPAAVGAGVGLATLYTGLADPNGSAPFPFCPLKLLTGLDCPFCGGLRATHALAHGQVALAANHNLLFTVSVPFLLAGWVLWMGRSLGLRWPTLTAPRWGPWAIAAVCLVFMVLRNLPVAGLHWLNSAA